MSDRHAEALERYEAAQERWRLALAGWEAAGRPLLKAYPNGIVGTAPELKVLVEAEKHVDHLFRSLRSRDVGRPRGSQSAPDRVSRLTRIGAPEGAV